MASKPTTAQQIVFDLPDEVISFDREAFDTLIRSQGPTLVQWAVAPCVQGKVSTDDQRRPGCDKPGHCLNGYVNVKVGEITVGWSSNSVRLKLLDYQLDGSSAHVTFPRYYDGTTTPLDLCISDRFEFKDKAVPVTTFEEFECHISGVDRLKFPGVAVSFLEDSRGRRYTQGTDFTVSKGAIHWLPGKSPGQDPDTDSGLVCSVRYTYHGWWVLDNFLHQARMYQYTVSEGVRDTDRAPQGAVLVRETYHLNQNQGGSYAERKVIAAPKGSFGPR